MPEPPTVLHPASDAERSADDARPHDLGLADLAGRLALWLAEVSAEAVAPPRQDEPDALNEAG